MPGDILRDRHILTNVVLAKGLYFGWMLSLPFHGPALEAAAPIEQIAGFPPALFFTLFHAATYLFGGVLLRREAVWLPLMRGTLAATILLHASLLVLPAALWPAILALFGILSSLFILGWTVPYVYRTAPDQRLRQMAHVIILANLVYIGLNNLARGLGPRPVLLLSLLPLLAVLPSLWSGASAGSLTGLPHREARPLPLSRILGMAVFVIAIKLTAGFLYTVVAPLHAGKSVLYTHLHYIPYLAVLVFIARRGARTRWEHLSFAGISLLGLSVLSFVLQRIHPSGWIGTTLLMEGAYALLDLFVWTVLGGLALVYGRPFLFFGIPLAGGLLASAGGGALGVRLLGAQAQYRPMLALVSLTSVLLVLPLLAWLNERIRRDTGPDPVEHPPPPAGEPRGGIQPFLLPGKELTPREGEIAALLLQGLPNREVACRLFISENTLKTHLQSIYRKTGVRGKKELLSRRVPPARPGERTGPVRDRRR